MDCVRQAGVFDISQVENAIVETNGVISVQKKSQFSPVTPNDAGLKTDKADVPITVVLDGKAVEGYYSNVSISEDEIRLSAVINGEQIENIMLMNVSQNGNVYIVKKEEKPE